VLTHAVVCALGWLVTRVCAMTSLWALTRCREAGKLRLLPEVLIRMTMLDLRTGQLEDVIGHLHEALQIISRTSGWFQLVNALYSCEYVCVATGRRAEAVTPGRCTSRSRGARNSGRRPPGGTRTREALRETRQALNEAQARATETRGAVMSLATAAEYVLMLTAHGPRQPDAHPDLSSSAPGAGADHLVA
jgi:hypothetical protein